MSWQRDVIIVQSEHTIGTNINTKSGAGKSTLEAESVIVDSNSMLNSLRIDYRNQPIAQPPMGTGTDRQVDEANQIEIMRKQVVKSSSSFEKRLLEKLKGREIITQEEAFDFLQSVLLLEKKKFAALLSRQSDLPQDLIGECLQIINHNPEILINKKQVKETINLSEKLVSKLKSDSEYSQNKLYNLNYMVLATKRIYEKYPVEFEDALEYLSSLKLRTEFIKEFSRNRERIFTCLKIFEAERSVHRENSQVLAQISELIHTNLQLSLKPLGQDSFKEILIEIQTIKEKNPDFLINKMFFWQRGYKSVLNKIDFEILSLTLNDVEGTGVTPKHGTDLLKCLKFEEVTFQNCKLNWINFGNSKFKKCNFNNCEMNQTVFKSCSLFDVSFKICCMDNSVFYDSSLISVSLNQCSLQHADFNSSLISHTTINRSLLDASYFFETKVRNSTINSSSINHCEFFGCDDNFLFVNTDLRNSNNPNVALLWEVDYPGLTVSKVESALVEYHSNPVRIHYKPNFINSEELDVEVKASIKAVKESIIIRKILDPSYQPESIPKEVISLAKAKPNNYPYIVALSNHAKKIVHSFDSLLIPGGADVEPEFYDEERLEGITCEKDFRRSMFEFCLLNEASTIGLPVMGVCRGSQTGNVFLGGSIIQKVEGQDRRIQTYSIKPLENAKSQGMIRSIVGSNTLTSISAHHQASSNIPSALEVIIDYEGIPKAMENRSGAPFIMLQFHPEFRADSTTFVAKLLGFFLSNENDNFWIDFIKAGKTYKSKRRLVSNVEK